MKTIDFSLDSSKNGGNVTALSYSHGLSELAGSWSASVAGGNFTAGNSISFAGVLKNGIITRAYKDAAGLWHIEGKDAGIRLMKSTPDIENMPTGSAKNVIQFLANHCGVTLSMNDDGLNGGLLDFNVRSLVSGATCAEAILELAMFSGLIAFIDDSGRLVVRKPATLSPKFNNVIDDSGSDIDLDGYATHVLVTLNRRNWPDSVSEEQHDSGQVHYSGETPSTRPAEETQRGTFSNGSYSVTMLQPFDVIKRVETSITDNGVTIKTVEDHDYDYKSKVIWRENQEYVLFAFIERGYTLTRTATGSYAGGISFSEVTTETLSRSLSAIDAVVGIPEDWEGQIDLVSSETVTRSTVRQGGNTPDENMPAYSPPFDSRITRTYERQRGGKGMLCNELEESYEARQVGSIAPLKVNGQAVPHFLGGNLAIQTHSSPQWVLVKKHRSYYEQYDNEGACILSTRSEYSDDGAEWLTAHALSDSGDEKLDAYQKAYASFSQSSHGLEVSIGTSVLSSAWHFLELQGRVKSSLSQQDIDQALGNISDWYSNGAYIYTRVCPHYNSEAKSCNVFMFEDSSKTGCSRYRGTLHWRTCPRALKALERARSQDAPQVDVPVIGTASAEAGTAAGYRRDIYVDETLKTDKVDKAPEIANTIARNILAVKSIKGLRRTVTVPYDDSFQPDGIILEVSHNWENLQTSITYREDGDIPDFLISESVSSIAAFVAARDSARMSIPQYGVVEECSDGYATVRVGNAQIPCTTKLDSIGKDDIVLVVFPAGNRLRGQIIARL